MKDNSDPASMSDTNTDQTTVLPVNPEKSEEQPSVEEYKNKRLARVLTFIGLQVALFLSALDG